jgi:hypothetical protein
MAQKQTNDQPSFQRRLGSVKVAVWPHENERGTWYATKFARSYKQGSEWKESTSFNLTDLPAVAQLASQAASWILDQGSDNQESDE